MLKSCSQPKLNYIKLLIPISPKHVFSFFILHLSLLETIYNNLLLRIQNSQKSITPDAITRPWICFNFCFKSRSSTASPFPFSSSQLIIILHVIFTNFYSSGYKLHSSSCLFVFLWDWQKQNKNKTSL